MCKCEIEEGTAVCTLHHLSFTVCFFFFLSLAAVPVFLFLPKPFSQSQESQTDVQSNNMIVKFYKHDSL